MNKQHLKIVADKLSISTKQVENTIKLLEDGAAIPFISRYRKEAIGSLDEVQITSKTEKIYPFETFLSRKETGLPKDSKAKCNQIRTIDKKRLANPVGRLPFKRLKEVEKALLIHLDII